MSLRGHSTKQIIAALFGNFVRRRLLSRLVKMHNIVKHQPLLSGNCTTRQACILMWVQQLMRNHLSLLHRTNQNFFKWLKRLETQLSLTNGAFVQMQWRGWSKTRPFPYMCYHAQFGRSALKGVSINKWKRQILLSAENPLSCDGKRGCPQDTRPSPHALPCQI